MWCSPPDNVDKVDVQILCNPSDIEYKGKSFLELLLHKFK